MILGEFSKSAAKVQHLQYAMSVFVSLRSYLVQFGALMSPLLVFAAKVQHSQDALWVSVGFCQFNLR